LFKGTSSFRKFQIAASWYTPLRNGWVVASHAAAGIVDPYGPRPSFSPGEVIDEEVRRVPLEDRFRIGGVNSVRAHGENTIPGDGAGGLAMLQANLELRIPTPLRLPLLGTLGFEIYADAGNVWTRPEYIRLHHFGQTDDSDPNSVRYVVGAGPRVNLPVGPLRVDVSWRVRPTAWRPEIQFAIGPSF
jgi:outer membrane protein insertion porin family